MTPTPPPPGTCWRHKDGFYAVVDRVRLAGDRKLECVNTDGTVTPLARSEWLQYALEFEAGGFWLRVPDAPATKGNT